jgi:hypothetical protein
MRLVARHFRPEDVEQRPRRARAPRRRTLDSKASESRPVPMLAHGTASEAVDGRPAHRGGRVVGEETVSWPGSSVGPGGGDADQDASLPCSQAADCGGLDFPLRRLTAIRGGRPWRRDTLAGATMRDDLISRRSVVVCAFSNAQPDEARREEEHANVDASAQPATRWPPRPSPRRASSPLPLGPIRPATRCESQASPAGMRAHRRAAQPAESWTGGRLGGVTGGQAAPM